MVAISHLRSLQAVELAARAGSLKGAADLLAITPAAVGQRVKALEDFLGVELFHRGRAGLVATPSLAAALPHLRSAFRELEQAASQLDMQRSQELHIAAAPDFADLWLRPRLRRFQAAHPNIAISINGEGEAAFRIGPPDCEIAFGPPGEGRERLFGDFVVPIASPQIAERVGVIPERERLEGFPLLHLDFYRDDPAVPGWREWVEAAGLARTAPDRGIRYRRMTPAVDAVLADAGLTLCGLALISERVDSGAVVLPFAVSTGRWTTHAFHLRLRAAAARPHLRRFRDWLVEEGEATTQWLIRQARP